jgi:hypothetical protein
LRLRQRRLPVTEVPRAVSDARVDREPATVRYEYGNFTFYRGRRLPSSDRSVRTIRVRSGLIEGRARCLRSGARFLERARLSAPPAAHVDHAHGVAEDALLVLTALQRPRIGDLSGSPARGSTSWQSQSILVKMPTRKMTSANITRKINPLG